MKPLQMFLLAADKLVRCRWDGRSDQLEIVNTALEGETLREVVRDSANPQRLYAATLTEIHVSEDGGRSFRELSAFRRLPEYNKWTFPPPPHTAHIRCITLDARVPDEILVGIEEGGVARSRDRGESWQDISGPS